MCLDQMAADYAAVGFAEYCMQLERPPLIPDRDVAQQRLDLDLFADGYFLVYLCLPLEITEHGAAERANRSDRGGLDFLLVDKFAEFADHLVTGIEHDRIGDWGIGVEQFRSHGVQLFRQRDDRKCKHNAETPARSRRSISPAPPLVPSTAIDRADHAPGLCRYALLRYLSAARRT